MRRRLVAINVGLLVLLHIGGCVSPVAEACPVCGVESDDDLYTESRAPVAVTSTAAVEVLGDGRARWTVTSDVHLVHNQSLASADAIRDRARERLRHADGFDGTIESVSVSVDGPDRVVVTATVDETAYVAPDGVVIYRGFVVGDRYSAVVVNVESLVVEGPGDTVYATSDPGERSGATVRYEHYDRLETDTVVVFGLDDGVRGSIQLRRALLSAHAGRLPYGAVLALFPAIVVAGSLVTVSRTIGPRSPGTGRSNTAAAATIAAGGSLFLGLLGWVAGVVLVAGVAMAFAAGIAALAVATRLGVRSRRRLVPAAFSAAVLGPGVAGWLLGILAGPVAPMGSTAAAGPPPAIATPGALGFGFAVWSTLVAAPMALGASEPLDQRGTVAGSLASAATVALVVLAWWWPVVAPVDVGGLVVTGPLYLLAVTVVAVLGSLAGNAFAPGEAGGDSPERATGQRVPEE